MSFISADSTKVSLTVPKSRFWIIGGGVVEGVPQIHIAGLVMGAIMTVEPQIAIRRTYHLEIRGLIIMEE